MDGAFLEFFVCLEFLHFDHLHRVLLVIEFVDGSVHFPVGAFADDFVECVVLYYADHLNYYWGWVIKGIYFLGLRMLYFVMSYFFIISKEIIER